MRNYRIQKHFVLRVVIPSVVTMFTCVRVCWKRETEEKQGRGVDCFCNCFFSLFFSFVGKRLHHTAVSTTTN